MIFSTTQGTVHNLYFSPNISIGSALQNYLKRVGREDLIDSSEINKLAFLYNATLLSIKDKRSLKDIFKTPGRVQIIVNDINNLIGA